MLTTCQDPFDKQVCLNKLLKTGNGGLIESSIATCS